MCAKIITGALMCEVFQAQLIAVNHISFFSVLVAECAGTVNGKQ